MFIVKNLSKSIGSKTLFENINFSLAKGERVALIGPNGAGKSTFLKILAGLDESDSGVFEIAKERVAYIPQEFIAENPDEEKLSGGEKTRLMIGRAMKFNPTLLLLDEPTNHLDKDGVIWVREFLQSFKGTIFLISHDRELLEDMTRIFEMNIEEHSFDFYVGGWESYKKQHAERMNQRKDSYHQQQKEKERLEERLQWRQIQARAHSNPNLGAQIRMMKRRLEREIYSQELSKPKSPKAISSTSLSGSVHDSKLLLTFKEVSFVVAQHPILSRVSFEVRGKERVVILGKNGAGKSTVLKMAMNIVKPENGEVKVGANITIGYFAQEHEILDGDDTVIQSLEKTERLQNDKEARAILASFLFLGNDLKKKVKDLSPGERVRLIFAKLTTQRNELLILDEPTNHLDIQSKEVIESALREFEGAILAVSHDKYFIESLGSRTELRIENKKIQIKYIDQLSSN